MGLTYHLKPIYQKQCPLDENGKWQGHQENYLPIYLRGFVRWSIPSSWRSCSRMMIRWNSGGKWAAKAARKASHSHSPASERVAWRNTSARPGPDRGTSTIILVRNFGRKKVPRVTYWGQGQVVVVRGRGGLWNN